MASAEFTEAIKVAKEAAKAGAAQVRTMLGKSNDADLMIYNNLRDNDFKNILAEYGPDQLEAYIQTMEAKRAKGG